MKETFENGKKYLLIIIFVFLTLPITIMFLNDNLKTGLTFGYLYALNPIIVFSVSLMYAVRNGFDWRFPVIIGLLFIPAVIIYFDFQNIVFALTYCIFSYIGSAFGAFVKRLL